MSLYNEKYQAFIKKFNQKHFAEMESLKHSSFLISGGTGLILSFLVDSFLSNEDFDGRINVIVRSTERAKERFNRFANDKRLSFIEQSLCDKVQLEKKVDYVIHGASPADPKSFLINPIDTMNANIEGTKNLLDCAVIHKAKFLFMSSGEIYGVCNDVLDETNNGNVCTTDVRSCYNESKRCAETYCASYGFKYQIPYNIVRISRAFGPSTKLSDSKAMSQFMFKALSGEDIILKSKGLQRFSYTIMSDVVSGIISVLLNGLNGEVYNIASDYEHISLADIATYIANKVGKKVVFEIPDEAEQKTYSKAINSIMSNEKLKSIGWKQDYNLFESISLTMSILKERM